jgi:hypothetical protein
MTALAQLILLICIPSALVDFAISEWKVDTDVRIEDAYKWIYQATRGGEHAAPDSESARQWMMNEWDGLGEPKANEKQWEPLCPGGEIGRFNLRPFRARGGKPDDLVAAFVASSREYKGEPESFIAAWTELGKRLKKKKIGALDHSAWTKLDSEMRAKNYPAVHHSETYRKAAAPAYRVLTLEHAKKLELSLE